MDEESAPHRKTYAQAVSGNAANLRGAGRSGVSAAGASVAGQKTYAQVATSRFDVGAAGDCRTAVTTAPHTEAEARLRS